MPEWQLHEAKNKLSEVITRATEEGPQMITRRGTEAAVVLSVEDYRKLRRADTSLVEFFRSSPLVGLELDFERSQDTGRDVEL